MTAAAPNATQPMPLNIAAPYNCHGATAIDQPVTPKASSTAPPKVTCGTPMRRYRRGRLATTTVPLRKCSVTAPDTSATLQPVRCTTACRNTGGP
ncbi:hypothetical protein D3C73_1380320 [compost metagenome]